MERLCSGVLIECMREGGTRDRDMPRSPILSADTWVGDRSKGGARGSDVCREECMRERGCYRGDQKEGWTLRMQWWTQHEAARGQKDSDVPWDGSG
jgi:hypothetical protein